MCVFIEHSVMSRTATSEQKEEKRQSPMTKILIRMNNDTKLTDILFIFTCLILEDV